MNRQFYVNKYENEIKELQFMLIKEAESIKKIKELHDIEFVQAQNKKYEEKKKDKENKINDLRHKLEELEQGNLDEYIKKEMNDNKTEKREKEKLKIEKQKEINKIKKEQSSISNNFYQTGKKSDQENRKNKKDIFKSWVYYNKCLNTIPEYMLRNLKEMPNNKGYIWKGIYLFGELEREKDKNTIIFDKKKNILIIHEWNKYEYLIYHKKGKEKKELQSRTLRKIAI